MAQDKIQTPLVAQTIDEKHESNKSSNFMVYLTTFVAVCGSFAFGSCAGYSSPTQSSITQDLNLSLAEYSLFGSILTFGAMIGAITSGPIADFVGRKGALRISSAFCSAGWLAIYFAEGLVVLDMGRLATGYGMGVFSYVVPVFIAEIAPKNLRGMLTAANQLMICAAVSLSFVIGTMIQWRILALIGMVPCVVLVVGLFFVPESPRWLAKTGNQKQFWVALRKLRGKNADISDEADEIQDYIETLEKLPKTKLWDLFQRRYSRSVIIGVGLMVCQQFGGINGICFYTSSIFESAGFPGDLGTIIYALLQIVVTALNALFLDKAGRKPLLLVSATGLVLGCLTTALSFYLKTYEIGLSTVPALAVTGILLYIVSFSAGMGAIPWVIMSEVFPINIKGAAGSLATLVNWFGAWAISFTFNFLLSWSSYGTFIIYAAINAGAIVFVIKMVPETKGRTLEQIQAAING
ncbi:putative major facilitator, sugar transporter, major facilitator superfamily [Helianthus annuus]|uniref:Major facilitator, sugar transporter, major facilitator superfamily n=1 Tax=Helianthus annuus TaxID=4232 RepID=A0A251TGJ3_HELAN|nr:sugar transporter ERD6-like 7 [Helianthus annuus]KAF5785115.1 putative major facilitator, sugar transporter, major facilitator superfamily [Helianthus annuus]KAJ0520324.1 putative major facilitator, sugar transporter, major facilitator superfamily [Helianthus annuus]KAJ0528835.1 putative major facilitator, sugar transporter, major facilitator superfamily [Helianthus annuus]KAJ0695749.1 putative major facilitator, sugar transporter, major facilitator superfamily [Helianthus annuus]